MSIEALALALHHSVAGGTTKLVLLGIANHLGDEGAWPSVETLSKYANASPRQVQRAIQDLVELGEIQVRVQGGNARLASQRTNRYFVNLVCPSDCDGSANHRSTGVTSTATGVTSAASGVTSTAKWGDAGVTLTLREPSEEPDLVRGELERAIKDGFEKFWEAYPRRQAKAEAFKAYRKALKTSTVEEILTGIRQFATDPYLPPKQFVPMPATWLNQERWNDGPLPERQFTPEEKAAKAEAERLIRYERDKARRAEEQKQREIDRINAEAARASVKRCVHDRVLVMCPECSRKNSNPAA